MPATTQLTLPDHAIIIAMPRQTRHTHPRLPPDRRPLRNARVNGLVLLTDAAGILGTVTEGDNTKQHSPRLRLRAGPLALGLGVTM